MQQLQMTFVSTINIYMYHSISPFLYVLLELAFFQYIVTHDIFNLLQSKYLTD